MQIDQIVVRKVNEAADLVKVFAIRRKVFVEEQECPPELEWEFEDESNHFLATVEEVPVAACRWRKTDQGYKLERFAVLKEYRGIGIGQRLVEKVLADLPEEAEYIYLHAQLTAIKLYEKFAFKKFGNEFKEAGIRHYKMVLIQPGK
ncbi:MAG: GNAT family N-acetyltransferase [Flavobacterium sp.]|nr:GNAT family N-acetyltransferase [Pedobacter sp.]